MNLIFLVVGHLTVFCFGMVAARRKQATLALWPFLLALLVFCLGQVYKFPWLFTRLSISIVILYGYLFLKSVVKHRNVRLRQVLLFFGRLSMYVFAVHGIVRVSFIALAVHATTSLDRLFILISYILVVIPFALLLKLLETWTLSWLKPAIVRIKPSTKQGVLIVKKPVT